MTVDLERPVLHSHTIRLSYGDTDPAQILYFAAWFPKMENLQAEFFYLQGLRQDTLAKQFGWAMVTRATECEYLVPVGLFEEIRIDLRVGAVGTSSFSFAFTMHRTSDETLVARASITLVSLSAAGTPIRIPAELRSRLDAWAHESKRHT